MDSVEFLAGFAVGVAIGLTAFICGAWVAATESRPKEKVVGTGHDTGGGRCDLCRKSVPNRWMVRVGGQFLEWRCRECRTKQE